MASKSPVRNPDERFVDAVKAGIEKLAADLNVPLSMGMGLTKAYFLEKGKVQAKVTAAEFEAAYGEIKAMHRSQTDEKKVEASDNGRLPLSEGGQAEWDRGRNSRWFKKFSIQDIRDRFATKIKGGEEVTEADLDTLAGEKDAEKAVIAGLVNARDDGAKENCGSPAHSDAVAKEFQPVAKFRIARGTNGWERRKHDRGNDDMEHGNVLVVDGQKVFYCDGCRQAAWDVIADAKAELAKRGPVMREAIAAEQDAAKKVTLQMELDELAELANTKLTLYTRAGADRKIGAIAKAASKNSALVDQLKAAGGRIGGSRYSGPRQSKMDRLNVRFAKRGN